MIKSSRACLVMAGATLVAAFTAQATAQTGADADGVFTSNATFGEPTGEAIYANVCAGCHMRAGEGAQGAGYYPALASNPRLIAKAYPLYVVMNGMNGMPPFADMMSDEQVAGVVNYIRTNFGNSYADEVTTADVARMR